MDNQLSSSKFLVAGHTDSAGDDTYNVLLSQQRADAVKFFLINAFSINPTRLFSMGFGEARLLNETDPLASENRRVEVVNIGN